MAKRTAAAWIGGGLVALVVWAALFMGAGYAWRSGVSAGASWGMGEVEAFEAVLQRWALAASGVAVALVGGVGYGLGRRQKVGQSSASAKSSG
jgi:hypothetical protein